MDVRPEGYETVVAFLGISHPEGNDDEEHLEKGAKYNVARERQGHDPHKRSRGANHYGGADLPQCISNASERPLMCLGPV